MTTELLDELNDGLHQLVRFGSILEGAGLQAGITASVSESLALRRLLQAPASQHELGGHLGLEKSTISRLVDSLHRKGWVTRSTDPSNARVRIIALSERGREVAAQIDHAIHRAHLHMVEQLSVDERAALAVALPALVRAMGAAAAAAHEA